MQHYANVVLDYVARTDKQADNMRQLKLALVTAHILEPFDAFPEIRPKGEEEDQDVPDSTTPEGDAVPTKYVFSEAPEDAESIEDELRTLLASSAEGTATFENLNDWM